MRFVKEMTSNERDILLNSLKEDGFKYIKDHKAYIEFKSGFREFKIYSTDLSGEDLGVSVDFDFEGFMAEHYALKTRHSVSLSDAIENKGSVEDACAYLGWKIQRTENLQAEDSPWQADIHMDTIYAVKINGIDHLLINEQVYAGAIDPLLAMGVMKAEELLSGTKTLQTIKSLN